MFTSAHNLHDHCVGTPPRPKYCAYIAQPMEKLVQAPGLRNSSEIPNLNAFRIRSSQ
jgi:hypothetical protein